MVVVCGGGGGGGLGFGVGGGGVWGREMGEENKQFNHCGRNGMRVADIFGSCYSGSRGERAHKERRGKLANTREM